MAGQLVGFSAHGMTLLKKRKSRAAESMALVKKEVELVSEVSFIFLLISLS